MVSQFCNRCRISPFEANGLDNAPCLAKYNQLYFAMEIDFNQHYRSLQ